MKQRKRKGKGLPPQLAAVTLHAAGIDIGASEHWVAVPPDRAPPARAPLRGVHGGSGSPGRLAAAVRRHDSREGVYRGVLDSPL